jgi:hypothetical protein
MNRNHALAWLLCALLLVAAGCEQTSIAEQEQIRNAQTLQASTPSATPTETATPSSTPTSTSTPTVGPSPTGTNTPVPSPTPLPPTATPNPALAGFSLCNQAAGDTTGGRFSAQVTGITTTVEAAFERVEIGLTLAADSAAPYAIARCQSTAGQVAEVGQPPIGSPFVIRVDLDGWLHDAGFQASVLTPTLALSGTTVLKEAVYRYDQAAGVGAALTFGVSEPLPFRLSLESNPTRLVLDVAKTSSVGPSSDMLALRAGQNSRPAEPLLFLREGDIWRADGGQPHNLSEAPRAGQYGDVTGIAVSTAAGKVAFCATAPGADAGDALAPSSLWVMSLDGQDQEQLADAGHSCAFPAFAPDGDMVAFAGSETSAVPPRLSIYSVALDGGPAVKPLSTAQDEWSRFAPQWLADGRLVYAATAEDGRSTLFLRDSAGQELDIGAELTLGDRYRALGRPFVTPDGSAIAVEGLRATNAGADVILLDGNGQEITAQNPITSGFWNRPVAWSDDGTLFYLTSECASDVAHSYSLHTRSRSGQDRTIAAGITLGGIGEFAATGSDLAYTTFETAPAGPRGPLRAVRNTASTLWYWEIAAGNRTPLVEADTAIIGLSR